MEMHNFQYMHIFSIHLYYGKRRFFGGILIFNANFDNWFWSLKKHSAIFQILEVPNNFFSPFFIVVLMANLTGFI